MSTTDPTRLPTRGERGERGEAESLVETARRTMRRALTDNKRLKFVAFVLAVAMFFLVNSDKDVVITAGVGVSYTLPRDKVLTSEPASEIDVTVRGSWRRIKEFDERELERINVDLTNLRSGGEYTFTEDMIRLPPGLKVLALNPRAIRVNFEQRAEKVVPVTVATSGFPKRGYKVERTVVTPSTVTIRGAEGVVKAISSVRTQELRLDGRSEDFTDIIRIVSPEQYVEIIETAVAKVEVELAEELITRTLGPLPVSIRAGSEVEQPIRGFETDPGQVMVVVRGSRNAVDALGDAITPVVKVFAEDLARRKPRSADVAIDNPPDGVGFETIPKQVTLQPIRADSPSPREP